MRYASLAIVATLAAGCATPWVTARGAITAADAALDALPEDVIPAESRADYGQAREAIGAAFDLGRIACDIWEREGGGNPPPGWTKWLGDAMTASTALANLLKNSGVAVPPVVFSALAGLSLLLPMLAGIGGGS